MTDVSDSVARALAIAQKLAQKHGQTASMPGDTACT